jgi:hypothetical protein
MRSNLIFTTIHFSTSKQIYMSFFKKTGLIWKINVISLEQIVKNEVRTTHISITIWWQPKTSMNIPDPPILTSILGYIPSLQTMYLFIPFNIVRAQRPASPIVSLRVVLNGKSMQDDAHSFSSPCILPRCRWHVSQKPATAYFKGYELKPQFSHTKKIL